MSLFAKILRTI